MKHLKSSGERELIIRFGTATFKQYFQNLKGNFCSKTEYCLTLSKFSWFVVLNISNGLTTCSLQYHVFYCLLVLSENFPDNSSCS